MGQAQQKKEKAKFSQPHAPLTRRILQTIKLLVMQIQICKFYN